jgi:hypothetical protein
MSLQLNNGEMAERPIAPSWKGDESKGSEGSNPSLSARLLWRRAREAEGVGLQIR